MNVAALLRDLAHENGESIALIENVRGRERLTTFAALEDRAARTASVLRQNGLRPGETVLVFQGMSTELYVLLAAMWRLGLTAMFVDPSAGRAHLDRCCERLAPRALIAPPRAHVLRLLYPSLRRIPLKLSTGRGFPWTSGLGRIDRSPRDERIEPVEGRHPALVTCTSGSTGEPKPVERSHEFLLAQHRAVASNLDHLAGRVELTTLPVFVLANLASRMATVIPSVDLRHPAAIDPVPLVAQVRRHSVNRLAAPPAVLDRVATHCERERIELPSVTHVFTGGGPVSLELLDRLQAIAPRARVMAVYGSTEAEPIACIALDEIDDSDRTAILAGRGLPAGRPVPEVTLRLLDHATLNGIELMTEEEFTSATRAPAGSGEIVVSGPHVNGSAPGFRVGNTHWCRTGDAGRLDDRGRLWLLGRCAARIDDDHGCTYTLGVEQVALRSEWVRHAAMISHGGRRMLTVVPVRPVRERDLEALRTAVGFAAIDEIRPVRRIPLDGRHESKIDLPALHRLLERQS